MDGIIDCTKGPFAKLGLILNQYADHLIYVLRTKTRFEQKELLRELNNYFPSLDVWLFHNVMYNIVKGLGAVKRDKWKDETSA